MDTLSLYETGGLQSGSGSRATATPLATAVGGLTPKHPEFADLNVRANSFNGKVIPKGQNVQNLAKAGYYHVGMQLHLVFLEYKDRVINLSASLSNRKLH